MIDWIFISFVNDHGISGIMPSEVSVIRNEWTSDGSRLCVVPANGHLIGHHPLHNWQHFKSVAVIWEIVIFINQRTQSIDNLISGHSDENLPLIVFERMTEKLMQCSDFRLKHMLKLIRAVQQSVRAWHQVVPLSWHLDSTCMAARPTKACTVSSKVASSASMSRRDTTRPVFRRAVSDRRIDSLKSGSCMRLRPIPAHCVPIPVDKQTAQTPESSKASFTGRIHLSEIWIYQQ